MSHPYKTQPSRARWSAAVARPDKLDDVYRKKFDIAPADRISAAGSCFAQHIGRRLAQSGFAYQDFEPAPPFLPRQDRGSFGYGMFSARYGNIYTVRQMVQLLLRHDGRFVPADDVWEQDGRFYDPYRPNIEPNGFASAAEFAAMRDQHYAAIGRLLRETDVLVFTLGLTEAWLNKADGAVYPVCPGTLAGTFDAERHQFRNFGFEEMRDDLLLLIAILREHNPELKVILTVSPVPLAATATDAHVLVATGYSKAVLRAVAGEVAASHPLIDYFPSYEIVTNPKNRSSFYEDGLREVRPEAVDHVMSYFFAQHEPLGQVADEEASRPGWQEEDIVCEEAAYDR